jgi:hypothetical protein
MRSLEVRLLTMTEDLKLKLCGKEFGPHVSGDCQSWKRIVVMVMTECLPAQYREAR